MATTVTPQYVDYLIGEARGHRELIDLMDSAFEVEGGAEAGAVTFRSLDAFTASNAVAATTAVSDGFANVTATGTLTNAYWNRTRTPNTKRADETDIALTKSVPKAVDHLTRQVQNQIVASLKAGSAGQSITLTAGYKNFLLPTAATNADVVNETLAAFERSLAYLRSVKTGASDDEFYIIINPEMYGRLQALRRYFDGTMVKDGARYYWDGIRMFSITGATNFGGASQEAAFFGHKEALGLIADDPYVANDGWTFDPYDACEKFTIIQPYAYGMINATLYAEILNNAT